MVAIIDYGMGNVASVQKALNFLNVKSCVTFNKDIIQNSDFIILPGVGSFEQGMINLRERGLSELLTEEVIVKKKKFLGICLGMQLIASKGTEPKETDGLGWIEGQVVQMDTITKRVPHLGWNNINVKNNKFFENIKDQNFYFIHSYHFDVKDKEKISSTVSYETDLVSSITSENIFATQFHPEKSQESGLAILKSFTSSLSC